MRGAMIQPRYVVQHASDTRSFVTRQIGGETLIVPVTGSVADLESIYVLNDVAARIWELLKSPSTIDRIAGIVEAEFEVPGEGAAADVAEFVGVLEARGLVQRVED